MKSLDYFYENYLVNAVDFLAEFGKMLIHFFIGVFYTVTIPLWILPYLLWKKKGGE